MPEETAAALFPIHHSVSSNNGASPMNVVVLILESFSYDYISYYHAGTLTTPFLDSLMRVSECWPNTHANAKRSIEGIPAILASIPAWMDNAFISSAYNVNRINSLASLLRKHGYTTGFFHGGQNGTMGFDNFSKLAGYQRYYGKDEYRGAPTDFDGHWGIHDHAFYRFMIDEIDRWPTPFHSAFFSLSSHHPYPVPAAFESRIPQGLDKVQRSIAYADLALREFFQMASGKPWFDSTLFVITADHSGPSRSDYTSSSRGGYHIPLLFYKPNEPRRSVHRETAQQVDILPSVMNMLQIQGNYSSFGRNLMEVGPGWSISYSNGCWQRIGDRDVCKLYPDGKLKCFVLQDTLFKNPLSETTMVEPSAGHLKSAVQQFISAMTTNRLVQP
jgi:phosphoglycerol transferase MdoB-like AlkP superfamily enzyme